MIEQKHIDIFHTRYKIMPSGCWEWQKCKDADGYGIYTYGRHYKLGRAHRFSYFIHKGTLAEKLSVCHTCDNPSCVNPDHLWLGTHQDNVQDMNKKGRRVVHNKKKIKTPIGIFESLTAAAKAYNRDIAAIGFRLKKYPKEYYYL